MRFYVGQTTQSRRRIPDHIKNIKLCSTETLHYYICVRGEGKRKARFIKLWDLHSEEESYGMTAGADGGIINILEMAFCFAFQTLPAKLLEEIFGPSPGAGYANVGLNIMPPLLQSRYLSSARRLPFVIHLSTSPDPELTQWLADRGSLNSNSRKTTALSSNLLGPNYNDVLSKALEHLHDPPKHASFSRSDTPFDISHTMKSVKFDLLKS